MKKVVIGDCELYKDIKEYKLWQHMLDNRVFQALMVYEVNIDD